MSDYRNIRRVRQEVEDLDGWAASRETHIAVAAAIHAIADDSRAPAAIWEAPTHQEWQHVGMCVEGYILDGQIEAETDGLYPWGQEAIRLRTRTDVIEEVSDYIADLLAEPQHAEAIAADLVRRADSPVGGEYRLELPGRDTRDGNPVPFTVPAEVGATDD